FPCSRGPQTTPRSFARSRGRKAKPRSFPRKRESRAARRPSHFALDPRILGGERERKGSGHGNPEEGCATSSAHSRAVAALKPHPAHSRAEMTVQHPPLIPAKAGI